nr:hypothetical protein [Tanacetum cinerariifolium]
MDCLSGVIVAIYDELVFSITQVVNLFLDGKYPNMLGEYIASVPLTPLVKSGGGIRPIAVGTIWRRLVSKVSDVMIVHSLDGYLDDLQFWVGVSGSGEAILHVVNRLFEGREVDVGLSMLLVDFKNAFNLVDRQVMLQEVRLHCPAISHRVEFCYSNLTRLYYGEHTLQSCQRVQQGDPLALAVCLSVTSFNIELVMKRVAKTIELIDTVARINDPQCELLLLRACAACSKVFAGDNYEEHVFCAGIIGIKYRHIVMRDTLVNICFRSAISAGRKLILVLVEDVANPYTLRICYSMRGTLGLMRVYGFDRVLTSDADCDG